MSWGGKTFFLAPRGDADNLGKVLQEMIAYAAGLGMEFLIKGASAGMIQRLNNAAPDIFIFERDRDNDDYIHLTRELIELTGRKFNAKKNHIHYFQNTYPDYKFIHLTSETATACINTAHEWHLKKAGDSFLDLEFNAVKDALEHFGPLGLRGGAIVIDNTIEAFSLGERLTQDMAVVHVEKGNSDIRGTYQIINQECCKYCWPEFTYVNREEDMGIPGLRKAKESYRPVRMIEKYDVKLRTGR